MRNRLGHYRALRGVGATRKIVMGGILETAQVMIFPTRDLVVLYGPLEAIDRALESQCLDRVERFV